MKASNAHFNSLVGAELNKHMKTYNVSPKIEKHLKKNDRFWRNLHRKKKVIAFITYSIALACFVLIGKSMWDGYWRTYQWEWRTPVIFQTPLMIKKLKPQAQAVSPMPKEVKKPVEVKPQTYLTEEELVKSKKHGEVLWKVYGLESTWGRNDYCRNTGKGFAGYGVLDSGKIVCYETFEKATERAEYWLVKNGIEKDVASALCSWNTGVRQPNCHYFQSYLSL